MNFYLSDIRWFDYQQGIYEIDNKKELKSYEINESLYSRSNQTNLDVKRSISSSKNSQYLKEMLNEAHIMNDEFYHIIGENEDPKVIGIFQPNMNSNISYCPSHIRNSSDQIPFHNNTLIQPGLSDNFQKSEDSYSNSNGGNNNINDQNEGDNDYKAELLVYQMNKCLFHYKGITEKIEAHLSDEKNIFGCMKRKFILNFLKKHHYFYKSSDIKCYSRQIFKELKVFITFFQEILSIFYKLIDYKSVLNYFLFTKENLLNFVTSLMFNSDELATLVFNVNQALNKEDEITLQFKYENAKDFLPADFEVSRKYCLNEKTLQYIYEKKNLVGEENEKSNLTSTELPEKNLTMTDCKKINNRQMDFDDETQKIKIKIKEKPFQKAILKLRKITQFSSPLHKLKTILLTSERLFKEISDFYGEFDIQLNEGVGGDELLGLFVYVVAQAKIPDFLSHCAMIKTFLTSNLTNSISGYYLVTIQVALDYLLSMKIDKKTRTYSSMKDFHLFIKNGSYK